MLWFRGVHNRAHNAANSSGQGEQQGGYHGDPSRRHKFWVYPRNKPLVTSRWDTHLPAAQFCSNHRVVNSPMEGATPACYICLGHEQQEPQQPKAMALNGPSYGTGMLVEGFHGDPRRDHNFWVYPRHERLITPRWDTHGTPDQFCTNCRVLTRRPDWTPERCVCLGHVVPSGAEGPAAVSTSQTGSTDPSPLGFGQLVGGFHGDPNRENRFWIYAPQERLITPRWDTHLSPEQFCSNHRVIERHGRDHRARTCVCLGHIIDTEVDAKSAAIEHTATTTFVSEHSPEQRCIEVLKKLGFEFNASDPTFLQGMYVCDYNAEIIVDHVLNGELALPPPHAYLAPSPSTRMENNRTLSIFRMGNAAARAGSSASASATSTGVLREYARAKSLIAIHPKIMSTAPQTVTINKLHEFCNLQSTFSSAATNNNSINTNRSRGGGVPHLASIPAVSSSSFSSAAAYAAVFGSLQSQQRFRPGVAGVDEVALNAVRVAFASHFPQQGTKTGFAIQAGTIPDAMVRRFQCSIPDVTSGHGNMFDAVVGFHRSMDQHRREVLEKALFFLLLCATPSQPSLSSPNARASSAVGASFSVQQWSADNAMQLKILIGYMQRGMRECEARRWWVYTLILQTCTELFRVLDTLPVPVDTTAAGSVCCTDGTPSEQEQQRESAQMQSESQNIGQSKGQHEMPQAQQDNDSPQQSVRDRSARVQLISALTAEIDSYKERAFRTVFMEPSAAYCRSAGRDSTDLDVHGANLYLALLETVLDVRMSRSPLMSDDAKGFVDYLQLADESSDFMTKFLPELWKDQNLGKSEGAFARISRNTRGRSNVGGGVYRRGGGGGGGMNEFCFGSAARVSDLALRSLSVDARWINGRIRCARYMEQFAHYFSVEFILERLVNVITQNDALSHCADIVLCQMQQQQQRDDPATPSLAGGAQNARAGVAVERESEDVGKKREREKNTAKNKDKDKNKDRNKNENELVNGSGSERESTWERSGLTNDSTEESRSSTAEWEIVQQGADEAAPSAVVESTHAVIAIASRGAEYGGRDGVGAGKISTDGEGGEREGRAEKKKEKEEEEELAVSFRYHVFDEERGYEFQTERALAFLRYLEICH